MKKRYIFLAILVLIIGGVYFFAPSLESIVQQAVHKYGSQITGTDVNIKGFDLSLRNGEGRISNITVANPKNYTTPYVFELGEVSVKVNLKSLTTDTIIIDSIEVSKPVITYEILSLTQNNITEIQNNVKRNTAAVAKKETPKAEQSTEAVKKEETSGGKKVIIKSLVIKDGEIHAVAVQNNSATVKLPEITMTNIGGGAKGGEAIAVTVSKVITQILNTASSTIVNSKISDLKGVAEKNLDNVVGGVKDRVKTIGIFGK